MKKFLFFANSTSDAALLLADDLVLISINPTSGTSLEMHFKDVNGNLGATTVIELTIVDNTGDSVTANIMQEITFGDEAMIVIADEINSIFLDDNITAVTNAITV